jgi:hypothetical protein
MKTWPAAKDPDEVKDYQINWRPLLKSDDTISSSTWVIEDDDTLAVDSDSHTGTTTTIWLSGGTLGTCQIRNTIITEGGRTYEQTAKLRIKEK